MELRKDYLLNRYVIISPKRGARPDNFNNSSSNNSENSNSKIDPNCFFCLGSENTTTPEIGHIDDVDNIVSNNSVNLNSNSPHWKIRWFTNKFAAVEPVGQKDVRTDNTFYTFSGSYGYHEVICETNDHSKQIYDLSKKDLHDILTVYKNRILTISKDTAVKYVQVFKNHGPDAGTSLKHAHSQIISLNIIPPHIMELVDLSNSYASKNYDHHCPYQDIINFEKNSLRRCFENEAFVAFTPYASRFNYEIWILPKNYRESIAQLSNQELNDLADLYSVVLSRLKLIGCSFNMVLIDTPQSIIDSGKPGFRFRMEILPRIAKFAGFENATDIIINAVTPEDAARFYRGEN